MKLINSGETKYILIHTKQFFTFVILFFPPKIELAYISDRNRIIIHSLDIYIYLIISQNNDSKKKSFS